MVEFGLKLEDNKVQEWSDKYINYEQLKKLIKSAKKAADARKDLDKRHPTLAAEVRAKQAAEQVKSTHSLPTVIDKNDLDVTTSAAASVSDGNKTPTDPLAFSAHSAPGSPNPDIDEDSAIVTEGELELLLPIKDKDGAMTGGSASCGNSVSSRAAKYGSNGSTKSSKSRLKRNFSENSFGSFFSSKVKGLLKPSYEQNIIDAIQAEKLAQEKFIIEIYRSVSSVNSFYSGIADDIENRLNLLREEVGPSYVFKKPDKHRLRNFRQNVQKRMTSIKTSVTNVHIHPSHENHGTVGRENSGSTHLGGGEEYVSDDDLELEELTHSERLTYDAKVKEADSVKRALVDMHRRSKLLINFAIMNSTGYVKIIKKFTKNFPEMKNEFDSLAKKGYSCEEGKRAIALSEQMEKYYASWFCDGNETEARSTMLPKKGDGLEMDWSQLRLGYRLGMCSILAIWVTWDCIWGLVRDGNSTIGGRTAFPVFRACGGLLLVHWFWGLSVYIWNRYRVNYIFLFDLDPRIVETPMMIMEDATDETLVFLTLMLLYYKSGLGDIPDVIPPGGYPLILVLYTLKCLIFPLRTRIPIWKAILAVVTAPLTAPTFFHTYVADVFTSMVKVFQDILWTCCFIISGDFLISEREDMDIEPMLWHEKFWYKNIVIPLVCLFPLWIRFAQCLRRYMDTRKRMPNLANAFKYALSQMVTLFGAFHPLYLMHVEHSTINISDDVVLDKMVDGTPSLFNYFWFGIFIASSLYSFFWDVYFDWGLGRLKHGFLGSRLMYPKKSNYYAVMVADLFLRFMWVTTLIPPQSGAAFEIPNYLTMITMAIELLRRTLWGFFRLEHEHRHNTSGFRRVDFVPLHFSTEQVHKHKKKERIGWSVLGEVMIITCIVLIICAASVIAAQKATHGMAMANDSGSNDL